MDKQVHKVVYGKTVVYILQQKCRYGKQVFVFKTKDETTSIGVAKPEVLFIKQSSCKKNMKLQSGRGKQALCAYIAHDVRVVVLC